MVGTTGSGKSALALQLASRLNVPYIQLDKLFWKPNWEESKDEEFFEKIRLAVDKPRWVLDGNYGRTHHLTWKDADTVIWIDFPFWLTMYQNISRSVKRAISKTELWEGTGNKESFFRMLSKDSIIRWLIKTYETNVKRYEERIKNPEFSHIKFIRLKSRQEVASFLNKVNLEYSNPVSKDQVHQ